MNASASHPLIEHPRRDAIAYVVDPFGLIRVAGSDAMKVLNGLCTANLIKLPEDACTEAFFADDRGRVLVHAMVARDAGGGWIVGQIADPAALAAHIDRFIFREDATPRDVTSQWFGVLIDGPEALSQLAKAAGIDVAELVARGVMQLQIGGAEAIEVMAVRLPISSAEARWCGCRVEQREQLLRALRALGIGGAVIDDVRSGEVSAGDASLGQAQIAQAAELESLRVANFWPLGGREITERTLPQELNRSGATISFTKGCYLGQETVARLDALGEVQKKLCLVQLNSPVPVAEGEPLFRDGKEVGKLTSPAPHLNGQTRCALAYLRRGSFSVGTEFQLRDFAGIVLEHPVPEG